MRTTAVSDARNTVLSLRTAASRIGRATAEISSGLRVRRPSDGSVQAAGIVRTRAELASNLRFRENLESVETELRAVDGVLSDAVIALRRAAQLAAQAANDTQDPEARRLVGEEAEGIFRHLVSISNTVFNGRYVFAGSLDGRPAFTLDENAPEKVIYQGDTANRELTFPDRRPAAISLPGDSVFLLPDTFAGQGRTPAVVSASPSLPIGIGLNISGDVEGTLSVDLRGPFTAAGPPSGASAGDVVTVSFVSDDSSVVETITTPPLAGGEDASDLAALLNAQIAANPELAPRVSFSDEGGALKLTVDDQAGDGFSFTSISAGAVTTGLESGGQAGGFSAEEIAAALNAAVAQDASLSRARVRFEAQNGEVTVDSDADISFTALDFSRGTQFASGLAGTHRIGGETGANVLGSLQELIAGIAAGDSGAVGASVGAIQRAIDHLSGAQSFYGATLRQVGLTIDNLRDVDTVNTQRLSALQDADLVESISNLQAATTAEELAIQVAARQRPKLLDVLG